jgi:cellobiose phosphorylase
MADRHLPVQTLYQTFVSRSFAQTQKGYREIGFREVQDLYATLPYLLAEGKKPLAEELLGKWIGNVHRMGYANHNFYFSGKEPGMCSDDQLWLLPAIATFVRWSGDSSILLRSFPMADGGERPLIGTIEAIITYSGQISVGKHGLPLLDRSDWNDTLQIDADWLDGPAKEKAYREQLQAKGLAYGAPLESDLSESVMNAFLLIVALEETSWLAHSIGRADLAAKAASLKEAMTSNVRRSAYINGYYARVLINCPHPLNGLSFVGAPGDGLSSDKGLADGSLYLNSLSWSLMSGVASESEIASMLSLADGYLRTPFGYKLCSECDLVRVGTKASASSHYFPGDRENGGVFKHAAMMFVLALLKAAKRD